MQIYQQLKQKQNAIGVRVCDGVCSVLKCAHSYQHCTCGQASACHVNGTCNTPTMPKQHNDVTNKMGVASPTQGNDDKKSAPMIKKDTLRSKEVQAKTSN